MRTLLGADDAEPVSCVEVYIDLSLYLFLHIFVHPSKRRRRLARWLRRGLYLSLHLYLSIYIYAHLSWRRRRPARWLRRDCLARR